MSEGLCSFALSLWVGEINIYAAVVHPISLSTVPDEAHKDNALETSKSASDIQVVDGAYTQKYGTSTEPVVIVASSDSGTSNAQLLNLTTTEGEEYHDNLQQPQQQAETNNSRVETIGLDAQQASTQISEINYEQPIQQYNTTEIITTESYPPPAIASNSSNNTTSNIHPHHVGHIRSELRTSARNLRNSVLGIEEVEEIDEVCEHEVSLLSIFPLFTSSHPLLLKLYSYYCSAWC